MIANKSIQPILARFANQKPLRTGSLIVTLFGDSIAPRGSAVWLGSLIDTLGTLGVSHRMVRTAAYRLVKDNILTNAASGRRSFYTLTDSGRQEFDQATRRIYTPAPRDWTGGLCMVLTSQVPAKLKTRLRKDLSWLGFGQFGTDLLAHPTPDRETLMRHLDALGCREVCIVFDAHQVGDTQQTALTNAVANAWDLPRLELSYDSFIRLFSPLIDLRLKDLDAADAFYVRTFLIHEYRKILLRDPALPYDLLPASWKGHDAYLLCAAIYKDVVTASEGYVTTHFANQQGELPPPVSSFWQRFGGLKSS